MLEVGVKFLDRSHLNQISLQFKWILFQFCRIGKTTELGEAAQNLTKRCNISTKVKLKC